MANHNEALNTTEDSANLFAGYQPIAGTYDEFYAADCSLREPLVAAVRGIANADEKTLRTRHRLARAALLNGGVTFSVRSRKAEVERIFPFDVIPRLLSAGDWRTIERGLVQRVHAVNAFIADVYGPQNILRERPELRPVVEQSQGYLPQMRGVRPRGGVHVHIAGIDLIRDRDGRFLVLEDNLRTPSGVSYVLENRTVMKRVFAGALADLAIRPVDDYPTQLREALFDTAGPEAGCAVILTPGPYNSAYFEHSYLARRSGCKLVIGSDLFVHQDRVYLKTTAGPRRVDIIYRRIDDDFLDPEAFRADSMLGVPGLFRAYAKGNVVLANGVGNGVADDKAIYPFMPDIVRFYCGEEPILGQVETLRLAEPAQRTRVAAELDRWVVKEVNGSGGYGMLVGPCASAAERKAFKARLLSAPENYIAQPLIELSTCPTWTGHKVEPRRVDLRPFVVFGSSPWVLPGGLTRVALEAGSYVVNSSQGGGSKDTWVLEKNG